MQNLKLMRQFYTVYSEQPIGQSVISQSDFSIDKNQTIGIVLCNDKKDTMIEMMLPEKNNRIFAAKYQTVLPSKDELRKLLEEEK
ncbi:hypothetical protein AGMMS49991_12170 [Spirochaetia bacterium]|nr:hypothetical protein AGMMS49991_12170 [Spirochaetia bacterium]